ncbi:MAG: acylphosphatase [Christensenellales bacterium]
MRHYHMIIHGKVQGVGLRYFIWRNASSYGICGWVRNRADGTVELDAQGGETEMAAFIKIIESGSRYSVVESVEAEELPSTGKYEAFHIQ